MRSGMGVENTPLDGRTLSVMVAVVGCRYIHANLEADKAYDREMRAWLRKHTWEVLRRYADISSRDSHV